MLKLNLTDKQDMVAATTMLLSTFECNKGAGFEATIASGVHSYFVRTPCEGGTYIDVVITKHSYEDKPCAAV